MGSLPFGGGGDADEMGEDLESFEKSVPLLLAVSMPVQMCLGTHTHNGVWARRADGTGMDGDWGRWGSERD